MVGSVAQDIFKTGCTVFKTRVVESENGDASVEITDYWWSIRVTNDEDSGVLFWEYMVVKSANTTFVHQIKAYRVSRVALKNSKSTVQPAFLSLGEKKSGWNGLQTGIRFTMASPPSLLVAIAFLGIATGKGGL